MRNLTVLLSLAITAPATAQDGLRGSDVLLSVDELGALLRGRVVEFYDGSKSSYGPDGIYGYTYTDDGPIWRGTYSVAGQSEVCVAFDNGSSRCDLIVENGDAYVLVIADGTRFPIRNITVDDANQP